MYKKLKSLSIDNFKMHYLEKRSLKFTIHTEKHFSEGKPVCIDLRTDHVFINVYLKCTVNFNRKIENFCGRIYKRKVSKYVGRVKTVRRVLEPVPRSTEMRARIYTYTL